jgi:methylmalonyl-CoA mutase cobalamin-binding subunit
MLDPDHVPPSFVQGDTISYTTDIERNGAICSEDTLFMLAVQHRYKTGSAALPVPLTENLRIPTADEIVQVQVMARELERRVPEIADHIRWDKLEEEARILIGKGHMYFERVMSGLTDEGVDVNDVLQFMTALRRMGSEEIETRFGFGTSEANSRPSELHTRAADAVVSEQLNDLSQLVVVLGSTDVHVAAKNAICESLRKCGASVLDCGVNCDPEDLVRAARRDDAHTIVVTTHNGVARSYGIHLARLCEEQSVGFELFMGGVLNEDSPESESPVDVTNELNALGISTPGSIEALVEIMATIGTQSQLTGQKGSS